VLREIGELVPECDIVMLCFEKDRTHCHRGLVAKWFLGTKGSGYLKTGMRTRCRQRSVTLNDTPGENGTARTKNRE
jgi:hypothetical protein